jgi:membrane protein YqaA with SNARE-associated domain
MGIGIVAALWGFAEATLFFLVPDIWLTAVALWRGLGPALRAAGWAIAGATAGGALMHAWGSTDPAQAMAAIESLPAISPAMIESSREALIEHGLLQLFVGSMTGTPYKIFAAASPAADIPLILLLLVSIPARAIRFVAAILMARAIDRALTAYLSLRSRLLCLAGFWILFYAGYLMLMPG